MKLGQVELNFYENWKCGKQKSEPLWGHDPENGTSF